MTLSKLKKTQETESCIWYRTIKPNKKGETMEIEVSFIRNDCKNSILNLWYKNRLTPKKMKNCIWIKTYVTDQNGNCYGRYNPILENNARISFKNLLAVSEININYLLNKALELGEF